MQTNKVSQAVADYYTQQTQQFAMPPSDKVYLQSQCTNWKPVELLELSQLVL
jgi:hypothetical protein